jgi:ubiquinone biosynthesis protein COQ9
MTQDDAILAMLPAVPDLGWSAGALRQMAGSDADLLFPGGAAEMVEAYVDLANRRMVEAAAPVLATQRLSRRVRTLIATRLAQAEPEKEAVRRAMAVLALPANVPVSLRTTAQTVNTIWRAAGDTSADFSWYTKRAILAGVYGSTLLFWLSPGADEAGTLAFLDRRLENVASIGRLRARLAAKPIF